MSKTKIEQQVMASVAVIYTARQLVSFKAIACYTLVLSVFAISLLVSVPNVLGNFSSVARGGVPSIIVFLESAVTGTTIMVQLGLLAAIFALGTLCAEAIKSFSSSRTRLTA